jgi:hypothetical protein
MVTPCFMLVYPEQEEVELYYGYTFSDNLGRILSILGLVTVITLIYRDRRKQGKGPAQRTAAVTT